MKQEGGTLQRRQPLQREQQRDRQIGCMLVRALDPGLRYTLSNGGTYLRLAVGAVPLPAPLALLACALGLLPLAGSRGLRRPAGTTLV